MVAIRRASKDYPLGGRDTGSIDTSTFSTPWLLILMSLLFCFSTAHPHHPAFISCHLIHTVCFQGSFFRFNMTLLQYHVIYMSLPHLGFLARLVFSGWYYSPHSLPPVLIPFQAILMVINVTPRHWPLDKTQIPSCYLACQPVSVVKSGHGPKKKSPPEMLVIEVRRYCILKLQDPISVSTYCALYSVSQVFLSR